MPELPEVESYRRQAEAVVGRRVAGVGAPDAWFVKGIDPAHLGAALTGRRVEAARRIGKLLVLDLDDGERLGLRFGMTGRLLVDGTASIDRLEYSSGRDEPRWDRFVLTFEDGGELRVRDPRRLGGVMLGPDESRLGVDALAVTPPALAAALHVGPAGAGGPPAGRPSARGPSPGAAGGAPAGDADGPGTAARPRRPGGRPSRAPLKARLLDQSRVAGIGNLLADEILFRAGLDPARPTCSLGPDEVEALARQVPATIHDLMARGGSHTGDLRAAATTDGRCPRDGAVLTRRRVGGRTTLSCPAHQA